LLNCRHFLNHNVGHGFVSNWLLANPREQPMTLLKHHLNRHPVPEWVHQQVYQHPYPKELMLRNDVWTWETALARGGSLSERTLYFQM
jgi:hypothetical protein